MEKHRKTIVVSVKNPDGSVKDSRPVEVEVERDQYTGEECLDGVALEKLDRAKAAMLGLNYALEIQKIRNKTKEKKMDELMEIKKGLWISFWKDFFLGPGMVILVFLALLVFTYVFVHGGRAPEAKYFEADGHEYVEFPGYCTGFTHSPKCKCLQMPESKPIKNTSRIVNTKKEGKETYVVPAEVMQ